MANARVRSLAELSMEARRTLVVSQRELAPMTDSQHRSIQRYESLRSYAAPSYAHQLPPIGTHSSAPSFSNAWATPRRPCATWA